MTKSNAQQYGMVLWGDVFAAVQHVPGMDRRPHAYGAHLPSGDDGGVREQRVHREALQDRQGVEARPGGP